MNNEIIHLFDRSLAGFRGKPLCAAQQFFVVITVFVCDAHDLVSGFLIIMLVKPRLAESRYHV